MATDQNDTEAEVPEVLSESELHSVGGGVGGSQNSNAGGQDPDDDMGSLGSN